MIAWSRGIPRGKKTRVHKPWLVPSPAIPYIGRRVESTVKVEPITIIGIGMSKCIPLITRKTTEKLAAQMRNEEASIRSATFAFLSFCMDWTVSFRFDIRYIAVAFLANPILSRAQENILKSLYPP